MVHRARKPPGEPSSPSSSSSDSESDDDKRRDKKKKGRDREPSSSDRSDNDKDTIRRRKNKLVVSSSGGDSDSLRSSRIGSGTSTTELLMFANRVYHNAKQQLDGGETNKEILRELKRAVTQANDKIVRYGDLADRLILKMNDKLFRMIIRIAKIIGKADERIQNRKVLPKPKLMVWTGEILEYASFRKQMGELLDYGNPDLELETLKQQIKGPKASAALKCLFNVRNKEHAFKILDRKYGDIEMVMPQLKSDLATLCLYP